MARLAGRCVHREPMWFPAGARRRHLGGPPAESQARINFAEALTLAAGQNPQIAFANEQIKEALAQLKGAKVLWLPSIQAGVCYINNEGPLQNSDGSITVTHRSALEAGLGMYAVGGGSPAIPGLTAKFALSDAVFQPHIAGQHVAAQNAQPRPPPRIFSFPRRLDTSIFCGRSGSRPSPGRRSATPRNLPS